MTIEFFVPGIARTAGSKSAFKVPSTGKIVVSHAGKYTKAWMDSVKWFALKEHERKPVLVCPIELELMFFIDRPQSHYGTGRNAGILKTSAPKYPTKKPDLTKLTRAAEDALTGIIWKDDSQVVKQYTRKAYCEEGQKQGAFIIIKTIEG